MNSPDQTNVTAASDPSSLPETIERRILDAVQQAGLEHGDLLPREVEFAKRFGVSRGVVREAITRLQGLGFVDRRKRRGTVMAEPDLFGRLARYMIPALFSRASVRELFELRLALELGAAELICAAIDESGFDRLQRIVEREQRAQSIDELVDCDIAFHTTLYQASGNRSLEHFHALLDPFFKEVLADDQRLGRQVSEVTHRDLIHALRSRDPERFRAAMRAHLAPYWQRYKAPSQEERDGANDESETTRTPAPG